MDAHRRHYLWSIIPRQTCIMKLGVLGGGQLGRMMALAGYPLGLRLRFFEKSAGSPASQVAPCIVADFSDTAALERFARGLDAVTYEFENVPAPSAAFVSRLVPHFYPPASALEMAQDRLTQKQFFARLHVPTAPFHAVCSIADLREAVHSTGFPALLKTRRWGYDGKGQSLLRSDKDVERAWSAMGAAPLILEGFVRFEREVSLVAVQGRNHETAFYPLAENHHRDGILRVSIAPAPAIEPEIQAIAEAYARTIFRELDYTGVLTIEFFLADGKLYANEMATRVHNSGHWTIDGAETSQFENHLRAVAGLPLGSTAARGVSAMVNFIGSTPETRAVLAIPGAHLHLYGKSPRPGRKLGHATLCTDRMSELRERLAVLERLANAS